MKIGVLGKGKGVGMNDGRPIVDTWVPDVIVGKTGDLNVGTTEGEGPVALKRGWTPGAMTNAGPYHRYADCGFAFSLARWSTLFG